MYQFLRLGVRELGGIACGSGAERSGGGLDFWDVEIDRSTGMNPLRLFSKVAAASPKKLSFDGVCDHEQLPFVVTTRGDPKPDALSPCEALIAGVSASHEDFDCSPAGKPAGARTAPAPGKGKTRAATQAGPRGHQAKGHYHHHHRRSLSNFPRLDTGDFPPPGRMLRQSASFSGISTPRSARPPSNNELTPPLSTPAPRSAGKSVRYSGSARSKSATTADELRIELEEDPTFWHDHSVQVLIRARPISTAEVAQHGVGRCVKQENAHTVTWLGQPETRFTFDHVAGEFVTQEELFHVAGLPMVDNCMAGYNSCMFAYGQTGSGKTYTMMGDIGDVGQQRNANRGMTPRVFEYLFAKIQKEEEAQRRGKLKYKCRCSFLEIYNEQISDLLEPSSANLQMREDANKGVYVEGLLEVEVQNVQDVLHLLLLGATNRKVAATNMNRESSRSHSVFTCVIESQWECDSMISFRFGRLNLVDLAGSERQKATGADGERLREATSVNKSLSTLGLVIMVLVDIANGKQRHVPYRDSKLTFLLQDSLGGNSKTTIIANISPSTCASSETLSTLKFAQRAKFIENNAVINEEASGDVKGLQDQIQQLKDELARIRRQSISRIPSVRVSDPSGDLPSNECTSDSKDPLLDPLRSSTEGSFLQFGRTVLGPTALSHKIKVMEGLLADALRREKLLVKTSAAEIEHLTRLVKQREDETSFHKSLLESRKHKIRRLEGASDSSHSSDYKSVGSEELEVEICNKPDHMRLAMENSVLQEQLRRAKEYDAFEERETVAQDISNLREKLLEMLDRNGSMESDALPQQEALVAELAAERQAAGLLRNEVKSYQRDLSECRMRLQTSLEANERMASELDALRMELESSQEDCRKHRQELGTLQVKALEVESLELKQAQHQQFMCELKTQLQKSEEKAEQEANRRSQLELQLQEALQESTNLQTELQWTRDTLEETEALVETFQRNEPVLEIGDPEGSYEAFMIGQLQAEIIDMHARLEEERKRGRELEEQIANQGIQISENEKKLKRNLSTDSCDATGKRRVRHHDAIMQLQMELETLDGGSPSASDAIKGYRWEDGTRDDEAETKHTVTIMQLQLDMEGLEGTLAEERQHLAEAKASSETLKQKLEETEMKLNAEKAKVQALRGNGNVTEVEERLLQVVEKEEEMAKMHNALVVAREHFNLERQTLTAAVADAEERYNGVKKELEARHEEFQSLEVRTQRAEARELAVHAERLKLEKELKKHLEAVHVLADDLQNQIETKEEEIVKLKEQMAQEQEDRCLEKSDLLVAVRESEARGAEKNFTIKNLQRSLATLQTNFYDESLFESAQGLRNQKLAQLEKKLESVTEAMEQLSSENTHLQRQTQLLRTETEDARKLVGQKAEELASVQKRLADAEELLEQENSKMNSLSLSMTEAASSEENWRDAREFLSSQLQSRVGSSSNRAEVELARTQVLLAGSEGKVKLLSEMVERMRNDSLHEKENFSEQEVDLVKSTDRPLRELSENRKLRLSDGKLGEKMKQEAARMRAEIAKLRSKVQEKETTILNVRMQLSSATTSCKEMEVLMGETVSEKEKLQSRLQAAVKETTRFRAQVQQCEAEMERLTMLLLEVQERHTEAEQSWMAEKVQLESYRHEAELQAATKKLKLPARFAKIDKWQRQLSEADKLMNMLVVANEKSKQECSVASAEAGMADKLVQELLEAVAMTKEQLDASMSHAEGEIRSLVAETQLLKTDLKRDILSLRRAQPVLVDEVKRSLEILPSVKCLESERRSWEQQCKSANAMLAEKEATIHGLHDEVNKARQQTSSVRTDQGATVRVLQEKEEIIRKLLNEVNQLKQSADRNMSLRQSFTKEAADLGHYSTPLNHNADRNMSLRQSLTKEADFGLGLGPAPLRRSFSLKLIEEKEMTLNVLKEEQEYLKTMVFSLDTENAELQQQLLDFEADSSAFKSTIAKLQRELDDSNLQRSQDVAVLAEQLQESTRHISELECQRKELRDEMQRQAVSFAALYEQLQKQEILEDLVRTDEYKAAENEEVLQILEEEKAELKFMVERLDAAMMARQSESKQLKRQVQSLQQELEHEKLQLKDVSEVRATLEADLARKTDETAVVSRELHLLRISAEKLARETEKLRGLVEELERNRILLEEQLQCAGDARSKVEELEAEKDKLQDDLNLFMEQLEMTQANAKEQDVVASEARKMAEMNKTRAEEKQVEVEILGRSVEELENTVYALESQVGLLKRECERQRLMREEMEGEMQGLKDQISFMHAALTEASTRSGDELLETKLRREDAERMLEEREAEMQQLRKKLEKFQMGLEGARAVESPEPQPPIQAPILKVQKGHRSTGSGAFGCIKLNQQMQLEIDEERKAYERRIQELEDVLDNHQDEVTMLHEKLADAERMTRDVLGVLRGVKLDMASVATLLNEQQVEGVESDKRTLQKDEEIENILTRLNDFIEERESWLEMISRKQADLVASQAAVEKLREREKTLVAEIKKLKSENRTQLKKNGQLEQEIKTLSGQQNLQQRIKHHARIKDENNLLRVQNNDLSAKLRRAEHLNSRVSEELAKYRIAQGKSSALNIEEEQRLRTKLQEAEEQRNQEALKLVSLCSSVIKAAGLLGDNNGTEPAVAVEAVEQIKDRLESTLLEFEDFKLKTRIMGERQRLNVMRTAHSPLRGMDPSVSPR